MEGGSGRNDTHMRPQGVCGTQDTASGEVACRGWSPQGANANTHTVDGVGQVDSV